MNESTAETIKICEHHPLRTGMLPAALNDIAQHFI